MLNPDTILGIILGLGCALGSSLAYLVSRRFTVRQAGQNPKQPKWLGALRLLVTSHVYLAVACGIAYFFFMPRGDTAQPADWSWAVGSSVCVALCYLTGNTCLFLALKQTDASRIAPLLGFKMVLLALVTHFILRDALLLQQWSAVILGTVAAWLLGASGGRLPLKTILLTLGSCAGFVCSDICISMMVPAWLPAELNAEDATGGQLVRASMTGMSLVYVWCGILAVAMLPIAKPWRWEHWRGAVPYAGFWLIAMVSLFSTFALVGIILGNILQATRGLMSIALGVVVVKLGHHHIESHAPMKVIVQRLVAAAMMIGAVALYVTAKA